MLDIFVYPFFFFFKTLANAGMLLLGKKVDIACIFLPLLP